MRTAKRTAKACLSLFRLKLAESLQYRIAALASASTSIFWALIEITVYTVFYLHGSSGADSQGLSLAQMVSYSWLGQALWPLLPMDIDEEIRTKITNGDVGVELCRPLDLYMHWLAKTAAGRLGGVSWHGAVIIAAGLLMPAAYRLSGPASAAGFVLFLGSLAAAFILCASFGMLVTAVRVGITWGEGPTYMLLMVGGVLSGGYLPLQMWPDFLQRFLYYQPFAGYLDLPLRLYLGSMAPNQALGAIALQLSWSALFILIGRLVLTRRLKNIIVQGG